MCIMYVLINANGFEMEISLDIKADRRLGKLLYIVDKILFFFIFTIFFCIIVLHLKYFYILFFL